MLDVLIINSPLFREINEKYDEDSLPPIGLGYIATVLKNHGLSVELIDAVDLRLPLSDLQQLVEALQPRVVATNIFTTNYTIVKDLIEGIKDKTIKVVIGGLSTKELYKKIFTWNCRNEVSVVAGDGEYITYDLIVDAVRESPYLVQDNFKFFQVFSSSSYFLDHTEISNVKLDRSFFKNEPVHHPFGFLEANIIASRGCVYNCAFCAAARSQNRSYAPRIRSIDSFRNELLEIKSIYPQVTSVRVLDDLFLKSSESIEWAISAFEGIDLRWRSMAHVQTFRNVDHLLMKKLQAAGCTELFIGIESGSPAILKLIHKTSDLEIIKSSMLSIFRAGINVKGYFIFGFEGETQEDMQQTYDLALFLRNAAQQHGVQFRTSPFQFRPYHGTELYDRLVKQGLYSEDINSVSLNHFLSERIGRQQFNFHSGNFSAVDKETLYNYICKTAELNPEDLFEKKRVKDSSLHL